MIFETTVDCFLEECGCMKYKDAIMEQGLIAPSDLKSMSDQDVKQLLTDAKVGVLFKKKFIKLAGLYRNGEYVPQKSASSTSVNQPQIDEQKQVQTQQQQPQQQQQQPQQQQQQNPFGMMGGMGGMGGMMNQMLSGMGGMGGMGGRMRGNNNNNNNNNQGQSSDPFGGMMAGFGGMMGGMMGHAKEMMKDPNFVCNCLQISIC